MRLLELSANKKSFRTVRFNPVGMSLIVGRSTASSPAPKKTYNAVGKSLTVHLVHFCLGASSSKELEQKLKGWEFSLQFAIDGKSHTITRSTGDQNILVFDGASASREEIARELGRLVFDLPRSEYGLTFRSLFPRFARMSKRSYSGVLDYVPKEKPFRSLMNVSFLLGLDPHLVYEKYRLKTEIGKIRDLQASFKNDPVLRAYYEGSQYADIELAQLEDQIEYLTTSIENFEVADDYNDIRDEAARLRRRIVETTNQLSLARNALKSINGSLQHQPDLAQPRVEQLYQEANFVLGDKVSASLSEVLNFHRQLLAKRESRLRAEQHRIEREVEELESLRSELSKKFDTTQRYLGEHRALEEFLGLSEKRADLSARASKLRDFLELEKKYSQQISKLKSDMNLENIRTQDYLDERESHWARVDKHFRKLCREFYSDATCGISIESNSGNNQIRFDLQPAIQADTSDGVGEVKMFCFDLTLLELRQSHRVDMLFHDSRLFSDMDPRQRLTALRLALNHSILGGWQYIASVNQDQLDTIRDLAEPELFEALIDSTILELTDESPASKLLGIDVELKYDK